MIVEALTAVRAHMTYGFGELGRAPAGKLGDWRLIYRTPARIAEVNAPFALANVALP